MYIFYQYRRFLSNFIYNFTPLLYNALERIFDFMEVTNVKTETFEVSEKVINAKKYNKKIFPIYKMFSWDLLFFYSISFLFLTQVKGFSASNVLLFDAFYTFSKFITQLPCVNIVEIIGRRKSLILANILVAFSILILIIAKDMWHVFVSYAFMGTGYSLKDLCDPLFLRDCITTKEHPGTAFSKADGRGSAFWYFFDAVTSISCGFLFVFNNYLPMFLCFVMTTISCIFAFNFRSYEDPNKKLKTQEVGNYKTYFKDLKIAFRNIFRSNRLKSLLLFSGLFAALLGIRSTIASSLFNEIGIKEEYFGVIFAILTGFSAISSNLQNFFHKRLKNKVLTWFSLSFSFSMIVIGLIALYCKSYVFVIVCVFLLYAVQYIIKGPYHTLQKRYLNSFSSPSMSTKIYSANMLIESLFRTVLCFIASLLLNVTSTTYSIVIIGCVSTIVFIFVLDYMKDKIGLNPEEYSKKDIEFTEVR